MQAVHVGIGGDHDLGVVQVFHVLLDPERPHDVEQLLVRVDGVEFLAEAVERLAAEREDRLVVRVATLDDRRACGIALGEEDHGLVGEFRAVAEVVAAVLEFAVPQGNALGDGRTLLLDLLNLAADLLVLLDLFEEEIRLVGVLQQTVDDCLLHGSLDPAAHIGVSEFVLGLGFEDRLLDLHGDGAKDAVADVLRVEVLVEMLVDGARDAALERGKMRAAVIGVLAVHEREIAFAGVGRMAEGEFERGVLVMDGLVEGRALVQLGLHQVEQSVPGIVSLPVQVEREPAVQVGVHPEAVFDLGGPDFVVREEFRIGRKADARAGMLAAGVHVFLVFEDAFAEDCGTALAVTPGCNLEIRGKRVHGLCADAVHADGEHIAVLVELAAGIGLRDAIHEFAQRDAASVVAHGEGALVGGDVDAPPEAHDVLVDGVVHDFLEHHVNAVVRVGTVAHAADVHARTLTDVGQGVEGLDAAVVVYFAGGVHVRLLYEVIMYDVDIVVRCHAVLSVLRRGQYRACFQIASGSGRDNARWLFER